MGLDAVSEIKLRNCAWKAGVRPPVYDRDYRYDEYVEKKRLYKKLKKMGVGDAEIKRRLDI